MGRPSLDLVDLDGIFRIHAHAPNVLFGLSSHHLTPVHTGLGDQIWPAEGEDIPGTWWYTTW